MSPTTATFVFTPIVVLPGERTVPSTEVEFGIPVMRTPAGDRLYLSSRYGKPCASSSGPQKASQRASIENPSRATTNSDVFNSSVQLRVPVTFPASEEHAELPDKIATFIKADRERKLKAGCEGRGKPSEERLDSHDTVDADNAGRRTFSKITPTRRSYAEILTDTNTAHEKRNQPGQGRIR